MLEINSAAQIRAERHFADEAHFDRLAETEAQFLCEIVFVTGPFGLIRIIPITIKLRLSIFPNQRMRGWKFINILINRARFGNILQT